MATDENTYSTYMSIYVRIVYFCKIWRKRNQILRIPYATTIIYPAYIFFFVISALEISHNWGNLEMLTETIDILCVFGVTFHKYVTMFHRENSFKNLIRTLDNNFFVAEQISNIEYTSIIAKCVKDSATLNMVWTSMCAVTLSSMMLIPWTGQFLGFGKSSNDTDIIGSFPYRTWTPFDNSPQPYYSLIYVYHVFMGLTLIYMIPLYDMLYFTFVNHTCAQFKILNLSLTNLRQDSLHVPRFRKGKYLALSEGESVLRMPPEFDLEMTRRLKNCVLHHEELLKFVENLENIVNPVFLSQFMGSSILFCMTGFQITVSPAEVIKVLSMGELLFSALFELGIFCYFANQIVEASIGVGFAAYDSEWYHCPENLKRSIAIIMTRSLKPVKITFGKFADLSLETYASILQISYTYFTVLNRINE